MWRIWDVKERSEMWWSKLIWWSKRADLGCEGAVWDVEERSGMWRRRSRVRQQSGIRRSVVEEFG